MAHDHQRSSVNSQLIARERLIRNIAQQIHNSTHLPEILNTAVTQVQQFLQTDRVVIYRFNPDWSGVVVAEAVDEPWNSTLDSTIIDPCLEKNWVELYQRGEVKAIANIYTSHLEPCHIELLEQYQVQANMVMPIIFNSQQPEASSLWGLLIAHHCSSPREWDFVETELLPSLTVQIAIAIQQTQQYQQLQMELQERTSAELALRESEHRYFTLTKELELRVEERTADLERTNQTLQAEISQRQQAEEKLKRTYISRFLVGEMLRDLQEIGNLSDTTMFNAGQELSTRAQSPSLAEFLEAFTIMGLGTLTLTEETPTRWQFTGDKLVEVKKGSDCPTCNYARGYLCGAVAHQQSVKVAAVEMACQSMGDHLCKFVVQVIGVRY
ncbi:MAG: GAF domain-containing protein [Symploca sp. SIO1A3]|nr:GAF domain-containing protein [Symploca sp. SIO2C1]NER51984.1 GAF domain-containing protein [Symploca sp. SIO1A3]